MGRVGRKVRWLPEILHRGISFRNRRWCRGQECITAWVVVTSPFESKRGDTDARGHHGRDHLNQYVSDQVCNAGRSRFTGTEVKRIFSIDSFGLLGARAHDGEGSRNDDEAAPRDVVTGVKGNVAGEQTKAYYTKSELTTVTRPL